MNEINPRVRRDLEFFPVRHGGQQLVLIRDRLGLVDEGKAVPVPLYQLMALMDGTRTARDLQMELMRQTGGVLVGTDEVEKLLTHLDNSLLLDSERYRTAKDHIIAEFSAMEVRPGCHAGASYSENPIELRTMMDEILTIDAKEPSPEGRIAALVAPHIDLSVGRRTYSKAYQALKHARPTRVIILGVGHHMLGDLFSLTDKAFLTPLGTTRGDPILIRRLREAGGDTIADTDFEHRSEHSIEFQVLFLQHLFGADSFTIVPILCGAVQPCLSGFERNAYTSKAGSFLRELRKIFVEPDADTVIVAGVDLSHIGPKFGHDAPASYLQAQAETHDKKILEHLTKGDPEGFWHESRRVDNRFNVCGFSALACLLEVLPDCKGEVLDYQLWHEGATRSAVSFAAVMFTS